ncbi:MAG: membrane protein insertion efficiency factor YidD [Myxococcales bacterium FL481]|nr:MAG: membrane protein insertion efficiency factor YidD [Myxococcales bacterium FL481]
MSSGWFETVVVALLRGYQRVISPLLGPRCRFFPSCSEYACLCVGRLGVLGAAPYVIRRVCRCHPWHPGGIDLPPDAPGAAAEKPLTLASSPAGPRENS